MIAFLAALALASTTKVGALPLTAGAGVDVKTAAALSEATAGALAKVPGVEVITQAQMKALLDHEAQKQLAGCADDSCLAQIGSALGVNDLVTGSVSKVGKSWLVALRKVEVSTGGSRLADRRLKNGTVDDVLDALPALVSELYGAGAPAAPPAAVQVPAAKVKPPQGADKPHALDGDVLKRLVVVTDGKDVTIAYDPQGKSFAPFFVAFKTNETKLYAQRVFGGGREGDKAFDVVFWEPRAKAPWQASFGKRDGKHWLQCGDNKIELTPTTLPKGARFFDPKWPRKLHAVSRTDDGVYFVVDRAREPEDSQDFRLYIGAPRAFSYVPVNRALVEPDETVLLTSAGTFKPSEWRAPTDRAPVPLKPLDVEQIAREVYGTFGVYDEPLGTPCDATFSSSR